MKTKLILLLAALAVVLCASTVSAATRYSVATGNWASTSTWSASSGGAAGASAPIAGDDAIIEGGFTVTVAANAAAATVSIANGSTLSVGGFNITISGATTVDGTLNITSTMGTKTFTGDVTVNSTGQWNNSANEAISFGGSLVNSGTFTVGTGVQTFTGSGKTISGVASILSLTINSPGSYTYSGTLTVGTALAGTGSLTLGTGQTLNIGGTATITTLTTASGSTVNYTGAAQTLKATTYHHLTVSGSGAKTMTSVNTVNGDFTVTDTAVATLAANLSIGGDLTVSGGTLDLVAFTANRSSAGGVLTVANGAILRLSGTSNFPANFSTHSLGETSTVEYYSGSAQTVAAESYGNLIFSGTTTVKTMQAGTSVAGNLSIAPTGSATASVGAGLTLTVNSLTLGGNNVVSGTWGSTTATTAANQNNTYFEPTTGKLSVTTGASATRLIVTLPGQTFASGTGNSGSPSSQTAGTPFNITLTAVDALNGIDTTYSGSKTVSYSGPGNAVSGGGTPTYTTTVTFTAGQATSVATTLVRAQTTTITATISGLTGVASSSLTVVAAAAAQLAFVAQPVSAVEGASLGTVTAQLQDQFGNNVSQSGVSVGLAIGNNPNSGTLTVTTPVTTSAGGLATFIAPSINNSGVGYTLTASSGILTPATSNPFDVTGGSRFSVATGNWSSTATWSRTSGGAGGAPVPNAANAVTIERGFTVTVDVSGAACASVQLGGTATANGGALTFAASGSPSLTVSGNVRVGNNGNSARTGTITFTSGSTLVAGSLTLGGPTGTPAPGTITMTAGGTLSVGGAITVNTVTGNTWTPGAGTVQMTANNTLPATIFTSFNNLSINGGTTTTGVGLTIGSLSIGDGATFTAAGFALTVSGTTTVGGGTSGTLTISSATGTKIFTGLVTINAGATWNNSGNSPVTFRGGITHNGSTFTAGSGVYTFDTNPQTLTGTLSIPSVTVTGVTLQNDGTLTVSTALAGTGTLVNAATGTLNINFAGAMGIATLTATAVGNTVNYTSGSDQTVKPTAYHHLGFSGLTTAKTMTGVTTIGGDLNISGSATMTGNASFTVTGTMNYSSSGSTTLTASTPISIGRFNQTAGTLVDNGNTITVTGTGASTWVRSTGTYTATGTVKFTGAAPQIGAFAYFRSLQIDVGAGNTATLAGAVTVAAAGTLTLTSGTLDNSANNVTLTSGATLSLDTGTLSVLPTVGANLNVTYTGSTATTIGTRNEIPSGGNLGTGLLTVNNTGGCTLDATAGTVTCTGGAVGQSATLTVTTGGVLKNAGTFTLSGTPVGVIAFTGTGKYQHNQNGGTIPTATWATTSTCEIIGWTSSTTINGFGQSFGNFTWNNPGETATAINLLGNLATVNGTLTVQNTGSGAVRLFNATGQSCAVGGDVVIGASGKLDLLNTGSGGTLNIGGNLTVSGTLQNGATVSTIAFTGSDCQFTASGTVQPTALNWAVNSAKNLTMNSGLTVGSARTFTVDGTLDCGTQVISGAGAFTLNSGAAIISAHASGLNGNITVTGTKAFGTTGNFTFNGIVAQVPGALLPATLNNLTIANPAGVTVNSSHTVNGVTTVNSGALLLGTGTLTGSMVINGTVAPGSSVGQLTTGSETWNASAGYTSEVNDANGAAGTGYDSLLVSGTGSINVQSSSGSPFAINLVSLNGSSPGQAANFNADNSYAWNIATAGSGGVLNFASDKFALSATPAQFQNDLKGGVFSIAQSGNNVQVQFTPNHAPVANAAGFSRNRGSTLKIPIATLLAGSTSDSDGDARGLVSVSGATHGTLTTNGTFILYTPNNHNNDSFTYTVGDVRAAYRAGDTRRTASGTISITVVTAGGISKSPVVSEGVATVSFAGIPGYTYDIQRTTDLTPPVTWTTLQTTNAPANGLFEYSETALPTAFYRLVVP